MGNTSTAARPATASAVAGALSRAGLKKAERIRASRGQVRGGWSTFRDGNLCENVTTSAFTSATRVTDGFTGRTRTVPGREIKTPTGQVRVTWQWSSYETTPTKDFAEVSARHMTAAADVLRDKGFHVEQGTRDHGYGEAFLLVSRVDENGEAVVR